MTGPNNKKSQVSLRRLSFLKYFLLRLYRPSGDILDNVFADSDRICRTYMQKSDIEIITLRNSPQSILFCSYSETVTVSD